MRKAVSCQKLEQLGESWREYDVIGIDEGQFFPDVAEFAEMCANNNKIVLTSTLYGTFDLEQWPNISKLIPLCEKLDRLSAICKLCGHDAPFTFRKVNDVVEDTACNSEKFIGGAESYMPLCRECHHEQTQKQ